jgi:hypothetical protein
MQEKQSKKGEKDILIAFCFCYNGIKEFLFRRGALAE